MEYMQAKKSKMITIYDYQIKPIDQIRGNVEIVYFVVKILNSSVGEDAIHLHIDLDPSIDRNIFTHKFCDKLFEKLPDVVEVYKGEDSRCKMKDISIIENLIYELQKEEN